MISVQLGVSFSGSGDVTAVYNVDANNIIQMLRALEKKYPALTPILRRGVAVAIDGQLYADAWLQPLTSENEIILLPQASGG